MGALNVTPESFSDGGYYVDAELAVQRAKVMLNAGADIIDIGGESTRPGAEPIDGETERARVLPIIKAVASRLSCLISIDTYRAQTAQEAIKAGAHIVNDVWGLQREPDIANVAANTGAGLVIMHSGRDRETLPDVIEDQNHFLQTSLSMAQDAGVGKEQIVLDPGFGFAKDEPHNIELLARFSQLETLGRPLLVGTSRKRFIGSVTGHDNPLDRDVGTAATGVVCRLAGASIFRVHNVAIQKDALSIADRVFAAKQTAPSVETEQ